MSQGELSDWLDNSCSYLLLSMSSLRKEKSDIRALDVRGSALAVAIIADELANRLTKKQNKHLF